MKNSAKALHFLGGMWVYKSRKGQQSLLEEACAFGGVSLDPRNTWVKLGRMIPWDWLEREYAATFGEKNTGNPAKPARMALGTLLIKERYGFSDEDTIEEIRMNPYLQHFIGLSEFTHEAPFDQSTVTLFQRRVTPQMLAELNDYVIGRKKHPEEKPPEGPADEPPAEGGGSPDTNVPREAANEGTLILDATCAPQAIRYPTDVSLLNEARELLEGMITAGYKAGGCGEKPRTYCRVAGKDFLRYARNRKPTLKLLRKTIRRQLSYVSRDIGYVRKMLECGCPLPARMRTQFETIVRLYEQQRFLYENHTHSMPDRIVSIHQPWVRPIVRGKANAPVEFGAKIEVSLQDGYARIEELQWHAFNEGGTLQASVERYKTATGHYPQRLLADKLFRTRDNLDYCKQRGIHLNGPKLGRPPKDKVLYRQQCRLEKAESGERNAIECLFGVGKRRYSLGYILTRLQHTSEVAIHLVFLSMNLQKRLRSLLVFLWMILFPTPRTYAMLSDM